MAMFCAALSWMQSPRLPFLLLGDEVCAKLVPVAYVPILNFLSQEPLNLRRSVVHYMLDPGCVDRLAFSIWQLFLGCQKGGQYSCVTVINPQWVAMCQDRCTQLYMQHTGCMYQTA